LGTFECRSRLCVLNVAYGNCALLCQNRPFSTVEVGMKNVISKVYIHFVWSTHNRAPMITPPMREALLNHLHLVVEQCGCLVIAMNATEDRVHVLLWTSLEMTIADIAQRLKGSSSRAMNLAFPSETPLRWHRTYEASTVSAVALNAVSGFIADLNPTDPAGAVSSAVRHSRNPSAVGRTTRRETKDWAS